MREQKIAEAYRLWMQAFDNMRAALAMNPLVIAPFRTSAQAFDGLRMSGRKARRPDLTVATMDHNVPTTDRGQPIADPISKKQIDVLARNCEEFGITLYDLKSPRQLC